MISYLSGTVLEKGKDFAIILAGQVGYKVMMTGRVRDLLEKGGPAKLYTHQVIRDDAQELYGFASMRELEFFWRLISVSGVGPKMALHLMGLGTVDEVSRAIDRGDVEYLAAAPGIGRKTAQRAVLELRGKLVSESGSADDELVSALVNLGYPAAKARAAAQSAGTEGPTEARLKAALKSLSRR